MTGARTTQRALDGLQVGGGINKGPGGANAPGAPMKDKYSKEMKYRMKMRDGWFIDKFGKRVVQKMHRDKWESDDKTSHTVQFLKGWKKFYGKWRTTYLPLTTRGCHSGATRHGG